MRDSYGSFPVPYGHAPPPVCPNRPRGSAVSPNVAQQAFSPQRDMASAARAAGALFVLTAGAIHLWLYFDYFHAVHVVGVLFLLNAAAAAAVAIVLLASDHPISLLAGVGYAAGTIAAFLISVYHGLFGYVEALRGPWQDAAGLLELAVVVILLPLLIVSVQRDRRSTPEVPGARSRGAGY